MTCSNGISSAISLNVPDAIVGETDAVYSVDMSPVIGSGVEVASVVSVGVSGDSDIEITDNSFTGSVVELTLDFTEAVVRLEPWCITLLVTTNEAPAQTKGALLLIRVLSCSLLESLNLGEDNCCGCG